MGIAKWIDGWRRSLRTRVYTPEETEETLVTVGYERSQSCDILDVPHFARAALCILVWLVLSVKLSDRSDGPCMVDHEGIGLRERGDGIVGQFVLKDHQAGRLSAWILFILEVSTDRWINVNTTLTIDPLRDCVDNIGKRRRTRGDAPILGT